MDHWCHATVYWRIGMDRFGGGDGEIIGNAATSLANAPEITYGNRVKANFTYEQHYEPDWRKV
jgi:hypothetical protein